MIFINIKTTYVPIHSGVAKNVTCPLCGEKDTVEITIYQKHIDTGWIYTVTNKLSGTAYCKSCNTEIPNVQWTPEIEAAFEKLKAEAYIEKPSKKYSLGFKGLLVFIALMILGIGYALFSAKAATDEKKAIIENPTPDNKLLIHQQVRESMSKFNDLGNSWAVIRKVVGDTIVIQFHKEKLPLGELSDAKAPASGYDGEIYNIKKSVLKNKERVTEYHKEKHLGLNNAYIWAFQKE